ncbi:MULTISPECIES: hypothetical protein [unclassified Endozoicomonas]|uniref:hypothetical protein n=1 Tax=unclassified Endozoicomonas TaxID=2644528 RepID=UPI003BB551AF
MLKQHFLVNVETRGNWSQVNLNVLKATAPLFSDELDIYQRNIAFWKLYQKASNFTADDLEEAPAIAECQPTDYVKAGNYE